MRNCRKNGRDSLSGVSVAGDTGNGGTANAQRLCGLKIMQGPLEKKSIFTRSSRHLAIERRLKKNLVKDKCTLLRSFFRPPNFGSADWIE